MIFHPLRKRGHSSKILSSHAPTKWSYERKNKHIVETMRTLLLEAFVPRTFWCEATHIVVHLINCMPTPVLKGVSPFESLVGQPPSYSHLQVFVSSVLNELKPNYPPSQHNVSSWGIVMITKVSFLIIPKLVALAFL